MLSTSTNNEKHEKVLAFENQSSFTIEVLKDKTINRKIINASEFKKFNKVLKEKDLVLSKKLQKVTKTTNNLSKEVFYTLTVNLNKDDAFAMYTVNQSFEFMDASMIRVSNGSPQYMGTNTAYEFVTVSQNKTNGWTWCNTGVGLTGLYHSTVWGAAVGSVAGPGYGTAVGSATGLAWRAVGNTFC